jgi:hypothetical protein
MDGRCKMEDGRKIEKSLTLSPLGEKRIRSKDEGQENK